MAGSIVQSKAAEASTSGTTLASGSFASDVTAGNRLWVVVNAGDNQTITVSKNSGTATIGTPASQGSVIEAGVGDKYEHFDIEITGSGTLDLLVTYGATTDRRTIVAHEVTGVTTVDGSDEVADTGSNPTPNGTVNVSQQPAFGLAMDIDYQGGTPGVGSGWTDGGTFTTTTAAQRLQTRAITATGNVTSNFGNAGLDRNNAVMVVYREPSPPSISVQPTQQTASVGGTATFSLTAADVTTYQWQSGTDGENWSNVGTNSNSYTTGTLSASDNGKHIRCSLTNANGTIYSVTVRLFIRDLAITGKGQELDTAWFTQWPWKRIALYPENTFGNSSTAILDALEDWWWPTAALSGITATGIASSVAFGTVSVQPRVDASSIVSSVAFGLPSAQARLDPAGIATNEAFGLATLTLRIDVSGIASSVAFGTASAQANITATGIASSVALGEPIVDTSTILRPTAIASSVAFGLPSAQARVDPAGIATNEAFGLATLTLRLDPAGIASSIAFGTTSAQANIAATGIASSVAFGNPTVSEVSGLIPTGIASSVAFGLASLYANVTATGIASSVAFGLPVVTRALSATGIASSVAFGVPVLDVDVSPVGIASYVAFGRPRINDAVDPVTGSGYNFKPRRPIRLLPVTLSPIAVSSSARVGRPTIRVTASKRYRRQVEVLLGLR